MTRFFILLLPLLFLGSCSLRHATLYDDGDLKSFTFSKQLTSKKQAHNYYYKVVKNDKGQIISVEKYDARHHKRYRMTQVWKNGIVTSRRIESYFAFGKKQSISITRFNAAGLITSATHIWYRNNGSFESRDELFFDKQGREFLRETYTTGRILTSSKESYYDYEGRLDKEVRYFYEKDQEIIDYWVTIYDNHNHILNEEQYLPNGNLLTFYRYTYHPVEGYKEMEEVFDVEQNRYIIRHFNAQGNVLVEEIRNHKMNLRKKHEFTYNEKGELTLEKIYDSKGKLIKKRKPKKKLDFYGHYLVKKF